MKKLGFLFLVIFIMGTFIATFSLPAVAASKILKFSSPYGETNPMTSSMQWFGKELEKRTNGRYQAKFFFSGTMGKAPDMPDLCKNGVVLQP